MHFVRQGNPRGLGHAILCADAFVGDEPFAVLLGDDLVDERDELLRPMLDVQAEHGGCVVALMEVPRHSVSLYGCVAIEPTDREGVVRVTDLVEKPAPEEAPSNLAIIGRYVLAPSIFDTLRDTPPGRGGEIQITDALRAAGTRRRAGARRRLPRPAVRHRRPRRLPQGRRPAGLRAARPRSGLPELARGLRGGTGVSGRRQRGGDPVSEQRSVDEHLRQVLADLRVPEPIELALLDAQGLLCAEDVLAEAPLPGFDNSQMDGYAVRAADTAGATPEEPVELPVVGRHPGRLTGAARGHPWPEPADHDRCADAGRRRRGGAGGVDRPRRGPGAHRPAGGARPLHPPHRRGHPYRRARRPGRHPDRAGTGRPARRGRPGAGAGAAPAAGGRPVHRQRAGRRRPPPGPGEILDANSYALAAAARDAGAEVYRAGIVPDDHARLLDVLEGQLLRADLMVTSGGVSQGAYDVVKEALGELGTVEFVTVAMQPGQPQGFGTLGENGRRSSACPATRSARWSASRCSSGRPSG